MFGLLHMGGQGLQCLIALLAPNTFEHILNPCSLRGLADPLRLPRRSSLCWWRGGHGQSCHTGHVWTRCLLAVLHLVEQRQKVGRQKRIEHGGNMADPFPLYFRAFTTG